MLDWTSILLRYWCALGAFLATFLALGCAAETERIPAADDDAASHELSDLSQELKNAPFRRGLLLRAQHRRALSAEQVRVELADGDFDTSVVRYGVELYQIVYATIDPSGRPIAASGLLAVPRHRDPQLRWVSFTHGTEVYKGDAPSVSDDAFVLGPALTHASAGFITAAPDYLGLGLGPGPHPYMHLQTEVSAALDLLRASRTFARAHGWTHERSVFVTGFSQGSFAALGLARALEQGADPWFRLAAVAPISGPYQTREWVRAAVSGEIPQKDATMYLAYASVAWNRVYGLYHSPSEFFQPPYDGYIEELLDNTHQGHELAERTPGTPWELLTPAAVARYEQPDPALARPLDELASVCAEWTTEAPIQLYAARGDEPVPYTSSEHCLEQFSARGLTVSLVDLGEVDHLTSNVLAAGQVARYFESLRH